MGIGRKLFGRVGMARAGISGVSAESSVSDASGAASAKHPYQSLVVAVGTDPAKNRRLVRFGERLCRAGGLTLRLVHVYEPVATVEGFAGYPIGLGPETDDVIRRAEVTEVRAARVRLQALAGTVSSVPVTFEVAVGEVVGSLRSLAAQHKPCILLVGAATGFTALLPAIFSPSLAIIEDVDVPVLALPNNADAEMPLRDLRVLVADDLRDDSTDLLSAAVDLVRTLGQGMIIDTHVKNMAGAMFSAGLAEVYTTALGVPPSERHVTSPGLVGRIRPTIKRLLNDRARALFAYKGHEGVSFHSMVLRGHVVKALRAAVSRVHADVLVFGRHRALHREGEHVGHVTSRMMVSFGKPVLIVPV
jgi:nucleotide-binding universal stress UspA family protein